MHFSGFVCLKLFPSIIQPIPLTNLMTWVVEGNNVCVWRVAWNTGWVGRGEMEWNHEILDFHVG